MTQQDHAKVHTWRHKHNDGADVLSFFCLFPVTCSVSCVWASVASLSNSTFASLCEINQKYISISGSQQLCHTY